MESKPQDDIDKAALVIVDPKQTIASRYRALYLLRNVDMEGPDNDVIRSARAVGDCLLLKGIEEASALLKHECAYVLGQIGGHPAARPFVVPLLYKALCDLDQPVIARHEAGEALGAIGATEMLAELEKIAEKPTPEYPIELTQTCELAAARIRYVKSDPELQNKILYSPFDSVDPTPADEVAKDVKALGARLCDRKNTLYDRYKAMFGLRNIAGSHRDTNVSDEAVRQLCHGFDVTTPDEALLRHEVAFVLGQLGARAEKAGLKALLSRLEDVNENPMVRHEAAEALGAVANNVCTAALEKFKSDPEPVVNESCIVALDMSEYEHSESFEYATLSS